MGSTWAPPAGDHFGAGTLPRVVPLARRPEVTGPVISPVGGVPPTPGGEGVGAAGDCCAPSTRAPRRPPNCPRPAGGPLPSAGAPPGVAAAAARSALV